MIFTFYKVIATLWIIAGLVLNNSSQIRDGVILFIATMAWESADKKND